MSSYQDMKKFDIKSVSDDYENQVIPPGMDFSNMNAKDSLEGDGDLKSLIGADKSQKRPIPHIWSEVGCPSHLCSRLS